MEARLALVIGVTFTAGIFAPMVSTDENCSDSNTTCWLGPTINHDEIFSVPTAFYDSFVLVVISTIFAYGLSVASFIESGMTRILANLTNMFGLSALVVTTTSIRAVSAPTIHGGFFLVGGYLLVCTHMWIWSERTTFERVK
jgi:hypothetical protein